VAAVKAAKRSPIYREHRANLARVAPDDVWIDEGSNMTVVAFPLRREAWKTLCFGVDRQTLEIAHVGVVRLDVEDSDWHVTNEGLGK
jgi:hypothetical protein